MLNNLNLKIMDERDYKALNKNLNALKKEDVYVAVSSKKQAKQFKSILLALGEEIRDDYWLNDRDHNQDELIFSYDCWTVANSDITRTEITIKELIKLLVMPNDVVKAEEPKSINFYLSDYYTAFINPDKTKVVLSKNDTKWLATLTKSDIEKIFNNLNQ